MSSRFHFAVELTTTTAVHFIVRSTKHINSRKTINLIGQKKKTTQNRKKTKQAEQIEGTLQFLP